MANKKLTGELGGTMTIDLGKDKNRLIRGRLVQIEPRKPRRIVVFQFNPEQMIKSGSTGGWNVLPRPRTKPVTEWIGRPPLQYTFALFFDGWPDGRLRVQGREIGAQVGMSTCERACRTLEDMAQPRAAKKPPPILDLRYGPVGGGREWVIGDLVWQEERRNRSLERVQALVQVTLIEHVKPVLSLTAAERNRGKKR